LFNCTIILWFLQFLCWLHKCLKESEIIWLFLLFFIWKIKSFHHIEILLNDFIIWGIYWLNRWLKIEKLIESNCFLYLRLFIIISLGYCSIFYSYFFLLFFMIFLRFYLKIELLFYIFSFFWRRWIQYFRAGIFIIIWVDFFKVFLLPNWLRSFSFILIFLIR